MAQYICRPIWDFIERVARLYRLLRQYFFHDVHEIAVQPLLGGWFLLINPRQLRHGARELQVVRQGLFLPLLLPRSTQVLEVA